MRYLLFSVIGILTGYIAVAQQLQTSSMYDVQGVFHNPAMAGTQKNNIVGATYRSQWSGISGSPKTA
ncbi:MAG: type IX secretion system membrane protein PorP/SprF [Sphingobacteriales bacterium]|nr:MAG: type IX secretion system membrane protein PorP/SprF [Sphingobacteriales bacterium]